MNKYRNIPTIIDGVKFASRKEAASLDMRPCFSPNNQTNRCAINSEMRANVLILHLLTCHCTNLENVSFGQFGKAVTASAFNHVPNSTFGYRVPNVIRVTSKPKVFGIDTRRSVTGMANKQPLTNWTVVQFIRKAVSINIFVVNAHRSIPLLNYMTCPQPTGVRLLHARPEAIYWRSVSMFEVARNRTKLNVSFGTWIGLAVERCLAKQAVLSN